MGLTLVGSLSGRDRTEPGPAHVGLARWRQRQRLFGGRRHRLRSASVGLPIGWGAGGFSG